MEIIKDIGAGGDCNSIAVSGFYRIHEGAINTFSESIGTSSQGESLIHVAWNVNETSGAGEQLAFSPTHEQLGWRRSWGGIWTPWRRLATAEKPAEHTVLIINPDFTAWDDGIAYSKNQFNAVTVQMSVMSSNEANVLIGHRVLIGELPVGYRPLRPRYSAAFARKL